MYEWEDEFYRDDRLYYLDLVHADKGDGKPWVVITRRNVDVSTPVRVDSFKTRAEAVAYIKQVEPATPRISLGGKSPDPVPGYEEYRAWLESNDWPSAMDLYEESRFMERRLIIRKASREEFEAELEKRKRDPEA